jgi:hypothetical protein
VLHTRSMKGDVLFLMVMMMYKQIKAIMRSVVIVDRMSCEVNVYTIEREKRIKGL